jgi:hypothetical protein
MQYAYFAFLIAIVVTLGAVWYRDWKYPFMQRTPHWTKSLSHKIAKIAFCVALVFMATFLYMYFKEMI